MNTENVRVRFAPSPTGPLHMGGVRTALFNYLFAKKHGGKFILRIEDTDQGRYVEGAEKYIIESLKWCNILFDEGLEVGGDFGPYRQSDRKEIYEKYAYELIEKGAAYFAFDTPEELEKMRERLQEAKSSIQQYNAITRKEMRNSTTLNTEEVQSLIDAGTPFVIRYKMPEDVDVVMTDIIRGEVKVNTNQLDDKVLFKSDGMPTYHLANIVDDHLMKISHVIRGEEWLPSMPLHVMLYKSFGWEDTMPEFAHLPLLLKPNGKGKLSKRDGDKMGFPVFPLQWKDPQSGEISSGYKESGYFADSFVNILAFLGWNPGTEQEIFTMEELIQAFDLEKAGKSGSKFDPEKAKWFNHKYVQHKSELELAALYQTILKEKGINANTNIVEKVCALTKERVTFISDFWEQSSYFFIAPTEYDAKVVKKRWKENTPELMTNLKAVLEGINDFTSANTETVIKDWITEKEIGMGAIMNAFRLALVGGGFGVQVFDIIELIGKTETLQRIDNAINMINK